MSWLALLGMHGRKVDSSVSTVLASLLASAFAPVLLCPWGICMCRFGLHFLLCHLRAFHDGMLYAVAFAAPVTEIVVSKANFTAFACTNASVESIEGSQILNLRLCHLRMRILRTLVRTDVAILRCAPACRR